MIITAEQVAQAREIILETLDSHHSGNLPYRQVWLKPDEDFDGVAFLRVRVTYDGDPSILDIGMLNSYDVHLTMKLREAGIHVIAGTSYIPASDLEELGGEAWLGKEWLGESWTG